MARSYPRSVDDGEKRMSKQVIGILVATFIVGVIFPPAAVPVGSFLALLWILGRLRR